jgi:hypothetical protein
VNVQRRLSNQERAVIVALLQGKPETAQFVDKLDDLHVKEMNDGGMGSLLLVPKGLETADRSFKRQIVLGEFTDSDGVPVSVAVNVDGQGQLFEFDVWKADFSRLITWPAPTSVRIIG